MTQSYKAELKALLIHRSGMIVNDCRTFLAAKTQSQKTFDMAKSGQIGGGNLLCAVGLFSILSLLSKVFVLVKNYDHWIDLTKNSSREGGVNETYAFAEFVDYLQKNNLNLGLPNKKDENQKIWSRIRDELSHMAWPLHPISSNSPMDYDENMEIAKLEVMLKGFGPPFFEATIEGHKELVVNVDRLYMYMEDVVAVLNHFIDSAENKNVTRAFKWISSV